MSKASPKNSICTAYNIRYVLQHDQVSIFDAKKLLSGQKLRMSPQCYKIVVLSK